MKKHGEYSGRNISIAHKKIADIMKKYDIPLGACFFESKKYITDKIKDPKDKDLFNRAYGFIQAAGKK